MGDILRVSWRDVGPCPCGLRPPKTDNIDGWVAWYDHLVEAHPCVTGSRRSSLTGSLPVTATGKLLTR